MFRQAGQGGGRRVWFGFLQAEPPRRVRHGQLSKPLLQRAILPNLIHYTILLGSPVVPILPVHALRRKQRRVQYRKLRCFFSITLV